METSGGTDGFLEFREESMMQASWGMTILEGSEGTPGDLPGNREDTPARMPHGEGRC